VSAAEFAEAAPAAPVSGFDAFFDDAALFPPGSAPMPDAVRAHLAMRSAWYAPCVGPFVCPVTRLDELAAELAARGAELDLALTVPDGVQALPAALAAVGGCEYVRLRAVEVPLGDAAPHQVTRALGERGEQAPIGYVEIPATDVDAAVAGTLRSQRLRLKLRTGGTTAPAFPTEDELAAALATAVAARLPFKCTAGLHRAVRHRDPETGFEHHGFLNVLLAVQALRTDPRAAAAAKQLADQDADAVAARVRALAPLERAATRGLFTSFGSCSVIEPLDDLVTLGLVSAQ
jgi:hypothetical protein